MFRPSIMLLATMLCVSCVSHRPIQDSSSPPIDAANPLDGTPVALAWSSGTQLMMGVDTGAVQTFLPRGGIHRRPPARQGRHAHGQCARFPEG